MAKREFDKDGFHVRVDDNQYPARLSNKFTYDVTPLCGQDAEQVRAFCQTLREAKPRTEKPKWYEPQMTLRQTDRTWRYEVTEAYLD